MRGDIRRVLAMCVGVALAGFACAPNKPATLTSDPALLSREEQPSRKLDIYIETYVSGYNTVAQQTDDTPCIAASGSNICGRPDAVACPPLLKLGTAVESAAKNIFVRTALLPSSGTVSISTAIKTRAARTA